MTFHLVRGFLGAVYSIFDGIVEGIASILGGVAKALVRQSPLILLNFLPFGSSWLFRKYLAPHHHRCRVYLHHLLRTLEPVRSQDRQEQEDCVIFRKCIIIPSS